MKHILMAACLAFFWQCLVAPNGQELKIFCIAFAAIVTVMCLLKFHKEQGDK